MILMLTDALSLWLHRSPDQTVHDDTSYLSYALLDKKARELAPLLHEKKYGICCENELNAAVWLLACLYAKAVAVPLSMRYGAAHCEKIIAKMHLSILLTDRGFFPVGARVKETADLSAVAVILSTSGTTGAPKGVMLTQAGLLANLNGIDKYFSIGPEDHILIARPLYHGAVLTGEFLIALRKGARISFYNEPYLPHRLTARIEQNKYSVLCGTPTLFYQLCALKDAPSRLKSLRHVVLSGECMTSAVHRLLCETLPNARIYHVYGLTEASPRVSALPAEEFCANGQSAGYLLDGLTTKIQQGELCIRGKSIMKGYYEDPLATRLVLNDGWLHTGDLAQIDSAGRITIYGRKDHLIIRGGMNIYPQEIEDILMQDRRIKQVLVYGVVDPQVGQRILLRAVCDGIDDSTLQKLCFHLLPPYQYPDDAKVVASLETNASGKLMRPATLRVDYPSAM